MKTKILRSILLPTLAFVLLPRCRKTETVTVTKTDTVTVTVIVDTTGTPVSYYKKKITGIHNWTGTYWVPNHTMDTNFSFEITAITDSILIAHIDNRAETLYYVETNELDKIILFNGSYAETNSNAFTYYLRYYYADSTLTYDEYYRHHDYGYYWDDLSETHLHSP